MTGNSVLEEMKLKHCENCKFETAGGLLCGQRIC
jgi:hypothetical protein